MKNFTLKSVIILGMILSFTIVHATIAFTTTVINTTLCNSNDGSITIFASGGTSPYNYSNDCGATWQTSSIFNNLFARVYQIKVKDALGDSSVCVFTTVGTNSPITFTTIITNATCGTCTNGIIAITANGGGSSSYNYSKNCDTSFQTQNIFHNLSSGWYFIQVKNSNGCFSVCDSIYIGIASGMTKINENNEIKFFPNPAITSITLHSTMSIINCQLSIEDVLGNKIYQQTITANDTQIDISKWCEGVYFYELKGANETLRGKFIKE